MIISNLLDAKIDRRRELLLQEASFTDGLQNGLDIKEKIELHELDEDIKAMKFAHLLTKKRI